MYSEEIVHNFCVLLMLAAWPLVFLDSAFRYIF